MRCPECDDVGWVRRRFLLFFHRRVPCPLCGGPLRKAGRWFDDRDGPVAIFGSAPTHVDRRDDSAMFAGGQSGGAGGGASWDDDRGSAGGGSVQGAADVPLIADPFSEDRTSDSDRSSNAASGSADSADSTTSEDSSSSTDSSGTAY